MASWRLTKIPWTIRVRLHHQANLEVRRHPKVIVLLHGILIFDEWGGVVERSSISIAENARFEVESEFLIGPGTHISDSKGGRLRIGGKDKESAAGSTCRTRIMVEKDVCIGKDCLLPGAVSLATLIDMQLKAGRDVSPVCIGNHVWISYEVSIVKGATIPYGFIVAPKSVVFGKQFLRHSLLAGQPAVAKRNDIRWQR